MAEDAEFADGLIVKAPPERAPDYVKAQISIKVEDLGVWLRAKHKAGVEWVNLDVKVSKAGKWYAVVFKPKERAAERPEPAAKAGAAAAGGGAKPAAKQPAGRFDDMEDDIPF